ncbi:MAG: hypothetical protein ACREN1_01915 [Candidatus Dormibacteria bacterium]
MFIGLGIATALALAATLHPGPGYWAQLVFMAVVLTVGNVWLVDGNGKWPAKMAQGSQPVPGNAPVHYQRLLATRVPYAVVVFGAFTAFVALIWAPGAGLVPGIMLAQGVTSLVRAEQVGSWERERDSELLVTAHWRPVRRLVYFVRTK